ncbi:MAG: MBL fold metallo-hydrolase [Clostridia bacterium]|mgnify:CR=1 FL=1|nr:MBL fold metallo-hydrolase [Clostridia bacterium]
MSKMLYQGHGSYRLTTRDGKTIYVDPYVGEGYDVPADLIVISHEHHDHNNLAIIRQQAPGCRILRPANMLVNGEYRTEEVQGITVRAVQAYNGHHKKEECVGYILSFDGITFYASGDTSTTEDMAKMADLHLDYAVFPGDGIYNMDVQEASRCASLVNARHSIPVHLKPGALYDRQAAEQFQGPGRLLVAPGEEIEL